MKYHQFSSELRQNPITKGLDVLHQKDRKLVDWSQISSLWLFKKFAGRAEKLDSQGVSL